MAIKKSRILDLAKIRDDSCFAASAGVLPIFLVYHDLFGKYLVALNHLHEDSALGVFRQVELLAVVSVESIEFLAEQLATCQVE